MSSVPKKADKLNLSLSLSQIAKFIGPAWGPPGSCWPQMGPMLAPWTLLSGLVCADLAFLLPTGGTEWTLEALGLLIAPPMYCDFVDTTGKIQSAEWKSLSD